MGPWSTWSAVISLTSRAGELRSAPSGPDDRDRVAGKRALAPGVRVRRAVTRVSEGWFRVPGFPLTSERPLYSELVDTTLYTTHVHRSSLSIPSQGSTARLPGAPVLPDSLFYSPAERRVTKFFCQTWLFPPPYDS